MFLTVATPVSQVFLDSSSGEPMLPDARQAWLDAQQAGWGDPARLHRPGRLAAQAMDGARELVAAAVGARPDEVLFTASGVHASQAAVAGLALGRRRVGSRIITTAIDHSAVLAGGGPPGGHRLCSAFMPRAIAPWGGGAGAAAAGAHETVQVDHEGHVDLDRWTAAVR